jgi:hypothetical protein
LAVSEPLLSKQDSLEKESDESELALVHSESSASNKADVENQTSLESIDETDAIQVDIL